jgi:hypothetical protein
MTLSRSRTAEGSKHHRNSNRGSVSLELHVEEFFISIFTIEHQVCIAGGNSKVEHTYG